MMLSGIRILEPMGLRFHNDDLDDMSVAFKERETDWLDRQLEILRRYDPASMSGEDALSYDILEWFLADLQEPNRWPFHDYPVNQLSGIQSGLPDFLVTTHFLGDRRDSEDYVERVGRLGHAFDQVLDGLRVREKMGP